MLEIMNKKIDLLMAVNNVTTEELAQEAGISSKLFIEKLSGKKNWKTIEAYRIAKYFNITLNELCRDEYEILNLKNKTSNDE